jgi:uncharacterized protein (TIGR02246 family)
MKISGMRVCWLAAVLVTVGAASSPAAFAEYPITQQATLMDRIQIEDLLISYMGALDTGTATEYAAHFTEDAVLDVDGMVITGRKAIEEFIQKLRASNPNTDDRKNKFHMLLNNEKIVINGNSATVKAFWTGIASDTVKTTPRFIEQGRYDDEVVKKDGKWLFKKRLITSDAGMPEIFDKTYKPR